MPNPIINRRLGRGRLFLDPLSVANLQLYLLSSTQAGANGAALGTWSDLSGNARDATQGTAANKPIIRDGVSPNGSRMIEFDGNNDGMSGTLPAGGNISIAGGCTIYVYCNETTTTSGGPFDAQMVFQCLNSASAFEFQTCTSSATGEGFGDDLYGSNSGNARASFGSTVLGAQILTLQFEPPSGAGAKFRLYRNGQQQGSDGTNWQATDIRTSYTVGNSGDFNVGFKGYIGAVLVYSAYHSTTTRTGIENYIRRIFE